MLGKRFLVLGTALLLTVACGKKKGDDDDDNANGPTPPAGATLTASAVGATAATVSWEAATDAETPQAELEYLLYYSTQDNLVSVADVEANGTAIGDFAADITASDLTGLDPETQYYFNVIVRDGDGLKAAYEPGDTTTRPRVELIGNLNPNGDNSGGIPGSSNPFGFTEFNGNIYFSAEDGSGGRFLYRYDGVNEPTKVWEPTGSSVGLELIVYEGMLYFAASNDDDGVGIELYRYDGTNDPELVFDINTNGASSSSPEGFIIFDGKLHFIAGDQNNGNELFYYDANVGGAPQVVYDLNPGANAGAISQGSALPLGVVFNNELYYAGSNGVSNNGTELYHYDGANPPEMVLDINMGAAGGGAGFPTLFDNQIYFTADNGDGSATELWTYDGTNAPTMVADINTQTDIGSLPSWLTVYDGKLYFNAYGPDPQGRELWVYDGTNAPSLVYDFQTGSLEEGDPRELTVFDGKLIMSARFDIGIETAFYDGTSDPISITDFATPGGGIPGGFRVIGPSVYFAATDPDIGRELWRLNR